MQKKVLSSLLIGATLVVVLLAWPNKTSERVIEEIEVAPVAQEVAVVETPIQDKKIVNALQPISSDVDLPPDVNRIAELFAPNPEHFPFIQTITYSPRVDWVSGRAAYLGDYAAHFKTSKHFISRCLHGTGNYLSDIVSNGSRFNVYERNVEYHMILDLSRLKVWTYVYDIKTETKTLLKTCRVSAGKLTERTKSCSLTPLGTFRLGSEIAVYEEGQMGLRYQKKCEMLTVFGKRWIPFGEPIGPCTDLARGLGIHGVPWQRIKGELVENVTSIGSYESNGCIRFLTEDIEELFALIVTQPTYLHIVPDFTLAKFP